MANDLKVQNVNLLKKALDADRVQQQFENALGDSKGLFIASLIDLYSGSSNLQECSPNDVICEALKAAVLKLPINKSLGMAWIVPYKKVATFQLGYKGYIQLAIRSGQYRFLNADVIYEGEFRSKDKLSGRFDFNGARVSDKITGYFAFFELMNGFNKTLYFTVDQVHEHAKKYSPSYSWKNSAWQTDFDSMALKTAIRILLSKWGILSVEMQNAYISDNDYSDYDSLANSANKRDSQTNESSAKKNFDITDLQKEFDAADTGAEPEPGF